MRTLPILLSLCCALLLSPPVQSRSSPFGKQGVSVKADGSVYRGKQLLAKVALPPRPHQLAVQRIIAAGKALFWIRIQGAEGRAAEVLYAGPKLIYAGPTGPQGVDGEWSRHLDVGAAGVLLYERRPGVNRCAGRSYLFPRRYDFAQQRFRRVTRRLPAPKAKVLHARRDKQLLRTRPLDTFSVVAVSSHVGDAASAAHLAPAVEAADGRLDTAWKLEGASVRGAFLTLRRPASPYPLRAIALVPGDASSEKRFRATSRVKSLLVELDDGTRYRLRIARDPARTRGDFRLPYLVELPRPFSGRCLAITVEDVYPATGAGARSLAMAEIRPLTMLSRQDDAILRLVKDLQHQDPTHRATAARILARQQALALPALAAAAPKAKADHLERIVEALARLRSQRAATIIFAQLPRISPQMRERVAPALRALGSAAVPLLAPLMKHTRAPLRHYAFRLLGQIDGARAHALLIERVGLGGRAERKSLVSALTKRGANGPLASRLLAALAKTTLAARRADLTLLLGRVTPAARRATTVEALLALSSAAPSFETRLRLLGALSRLDRRRSAAMLDDALRDKDPIIRWRALQLRRRAPTGLAKATALTLLRDTDPRIREEASAALRPHRSAEVTSALTARLLNDPWPQVARKAAVALNGRCERKTLTRFRQAVRKRGFGIDALALRNIVACQPRWLLVYLLQVAAEPRQPTPLRRLAAGLLPAELVKRHLRHVRSFFLNLRREALRSPAAEQVTASVVQSIARSADSRVAPLLVDALALDPSALIRAACAGALTPYCNLRSVRATLERASKDPAPLVAAAAQSTLAACRKK